MLTIERFCTDDEVARLEAALPAAAPGSRAELLVSLCWHLRQRDTRRALALADEAEPLVAALPANGWRGSLVARLRLVRGEAAWLFGRLGEADGLLAQALDEYRDLGDDAALSDVYWTILNMTMDQNAPDRRDDALRAIKRHAARAGDRLREEQADTAIDCFECFGSARNAVALVPANEERIRSGHPSVAALAHYFFVMLCSRTGDYTRSLGHALNARSLADATGQGRRALLAESNTGALLTDMNEYEGAIQSMRRMIDDARRTGWPMMVGLALTQAAELLLVLDRPPAAREMIDEALRVMRDITGASHYGNALHALGRVQIAQDEFDAAEATFGAMQQLAAQHGLSDIGMYGLRGRVEALVKAGRRDEGLALGQELLAHPECDDVLRIDALRLIARLHVHDAPLAADLADGSSATLRKLEEALALARGVEGFKLPPELLEETARELARLGRHASAFNLMSEARDSRERTRGKETDNRVAALEARHRIEQARAEAEHHRLLAAALERLDKVGREITAQLDRGVILRLLVERASELTGAQYACVYLLDAAGQALRHAHGCASHDEIALDDATSPLAQAAREGREVSWQGDAGEPAAAARTQAARWIASPLMAGPRLLGLLVAGGPEASERAEREQLMLRTLGAYGAIALQNAGAYRQLDATASALRTTQAELLAKNLELERAHDALEELSLTDPLTGLRNRRFLLQQIESDVALCQRRHEAWLDTPGSPKPVDADLCFFLVDVDHFKQVNDEHGHEAGDQVLAQMCVRLARVFRESDYLVRWGGEEFLVVARNADRAQAGVMAERVRQAMAAEPFDIGTGARLKRTCSVGWAAFPFHPQAPRQLTWPQVLALADRALFAAKRGGRNAWFGWTAGKPESSLPAELAAQLCESAAASSEKLRERNSPSIE